MTHFVQFPSEMKIRGRLKFGLIFFTFRKSPQHCFPRIRNGVARTAVNCTDSEMYLLTEIIYIFSSLTNNNNNNKTYWLHTVQLSSFKMFPENPFLKAGRVLNSK